MKQTLMLLSIAFACLSFSRAAPSPETADGTDWYDAAQLGIQGKGWADTSAPYTRFPERAKASVPAPVWNLSQHSAGLFVRFRTDAPSVRAAHRVTGSLAMPHMTAVGSSGLDLYAKDPQGVWRWAGISKPSASCYTNTLLEGVSKALRDYTLYLPLYNGTASLAVGVPAGSRFEALPPAPGEKPVVYYGTSIAHGCSASRPGMAYTAILGRRLGLTVVNLGFSGNGRMEPVLADLLTEIDAAVYVLDCLPNMSAAQVAERAEPFVRRLRAARPDIPVILVDGRPWTNAWLKPDGHEGKSQAYRAAYDRLTAEGFKRLSFVDGLSLFGDDGEGAADGSHPSDLGMMRQADILTPVLRAALSGQ
jgi:lysophospholipase L1-like esterase